MDLKELENFFETRQSCREFDGRPIDEELLREICRTALLAPSARNAQPWKLIAVTGEKRGAVLECIQLMGANKFASKAAALVAVAERKEQAAAENAFVKNDLGILTAHLVLAAEAAGVGSCIIGWRDEEKLRRVLGLEGGENVPVVVALGYAAEGYPVRNKTRLPLETVFELQK